MNCSLPFGEYVKTEKPGASFIGKSGKAHNVNVYADAPVHPGGSLGGMKNAGHALDATV